MNKQDQRAGDNSTNIQVSGNLVVGITKTDAEKIALETVRSELAIYSAQGRDEAERRAREFFESFLAKLATEAPQVIRNFGDPDIQSTLRDAGSGYIRTGDHVLSQALQNMLVDRLKRPQRDLISVVLNEAIRIAPNVPTDQLDALALIFGLRYLRIIGDFGLSALGGMLQKRYLGLVRTAARSQAKYSHLEYMSCGSVNLLTGFDLADTFRLSYQAILGSGVTLEEAHIHFPADIAARIMIRIPERPGRFRIGLIGESDIESFMSRHSIPESLRDNVLKVLRQNSSADTARTMLLEVAPALQEVFDFFKNSVASQFTLTSVGIALGHAHLENTIREKADLAIWIN